MRRSRFSLLAFVAARLGNAAPVAAQTATAISERAGMYSCTCADGRSAGPVVAPEIAMA